MLKVHEKVAEQRIKFASNITEVADDLLLLHKDTERGRKQVNNRTFLTSAPWGSPGGVC